MDEDEELYREMNEEDPFYMGDPEENEEDDEEENDRPQQPLPPRPRRKMTAEEREMQKKLDFVLTVICGIAIIGFLWWLIFV